MYQIIHTPIALSLNYIICHGNSSNFALLCQVTTSKVISNSVLTIYYFNQTEREWIPS